MKRFLIASAVLLVPSIASAADPRFDRLMRVVELIDQRITNIERRLDAGGGSSYQPTRFGTPIHYQPEMQAVPMPQPMPYPQQFVRQIHGQPFPMPMPFGQITADPFGRVIIVVPHQ